MAHAVRARWWRRTQGIFFDPAAREDFEHLNQRLFVDREFHLYIPTSKGRLKYSNTALVRSRIWHSLIFGTLTHFIHRHKTTANKPNHLYPLSL